MDAWAARVVMPLMLPRLFFVIGGSFAGAVMTSLTFSSLAQHRIARGIAGGKIA